MQVRAKTSARFGPFSALIQYTGEFMQQHNASMLLLYPVCMCMYCYAAYAPTNAMKESYT